jgi:hypothetical protein
MTLDYDLQLVMMKKHTNDKVILLTVDEIRDNLNLRYERLNVQSSNGER